MKKLYFIFTTILMVITGCSSDQVDKKDNAYPNADLLINTEWVKNHLSDPNVIVIDTRNEGYEGGHIPGAVHITWKELTDPQYPVEGYLVNSEKFTEKMQTLGINQNSTVVVYDDGSSLAASRLFYALEYYGHKNVKVVNGGFTAWLNKGYNISTNEPDPTTGNFVASVNEQLFSTKDEIEKNLNKENVVILDVRSKQEYTGKDVRAKRGGHIPNAVHLEWNEAITTNEDGVPVFKSYQVLKEQFENKGIHKEMTVIPYCQTNVRGAHTYFTLRLLGYENISPYEGSWSEWGNATETSIEK